MAGEQEAIERSREWILARSGELAELLAALIRFDTRSVELATDPDAANEEGEAQRFLVNYLAELGLCVETFEPDPAHYAEHPMMPPGHHWRGRPMTLAHLPATCFGEGDRSLALNGHLDVVGVDDRSGWRHDPFSGVIEAGRIFGRGASDMKSGIAAILFSLAALRACGVELSSDVWVQIVTDEETNGMGTVAMIEHAPRPSAAVFAECTSFAAMGSCRGVLLGQVELEGRAAHAEMPSGHAPRGSGVNAVDGVPVVLAALADLNERWATKQHPALSAPQAIATMIAAGEFPTTLAAGATVTVDVTYLPVDADTEGFGGDVRAEVEAALTARVGEHPMFLERPPRWTWLADYPPYEAGDLGQLSGALANALDSVGRELVEVGVDSWHDAATAGRVLGIPAVSFGPGEIDLAHTIDESIAVEDLVDGACALAALVVGYCGLAGR